MEGRLGESAGHLAVGAESWLYRTQTKPFPVSGLQSLECRLRVCGRALEGVALYACVTSGMVNTEWAAAPPATPHLTGTEGMW